MNKFKTGDLVVLNNVINNEVGVYAGIDPDDPDHHLVVLTKIVSVRYDSIRLFKPK